MSTAIGWGGNVDTLGAIVGALMGARLGNDAIPSNLRAEVVDGDRIKFLGHRVGALIESNLA